MSTHNQVAKSVRESKEQHPEYYCKALNCLWRTHTQNNGYKPCRKHPPISYEKPEPTV
jgi:hypothetical protein